MVKSEQFLSGNLYRTLFQYISLNVLSMTGLSLYVLADTFFIANGVGSQGLVALNLIIPAYNLINGTGLLLGVGGATVYSIATGAGNSEKGNRIFTQTLCLGIVLGIVYTVLGLFASRQVAVLLGAEGELISLASNYIKVMLLFSCAFILNNIMVSFLRNDYAPNLAMSAMLVGCLSNVVLDYVMIYPLDLGMTGAALATGTAPLVGLFICSLHLFRKKNHFHFKRIPFKASEIGNFLFTGVPSFINELSSGLIIFLFNQVILGIAGADGVAAYGITTNVALVFIAILTGISQGIQPVLSVNFGAGREEQVRKIMIIGCSVSMIAGIVFLCVTQIFPGQIASFFIDSQDNHLFNMAIQSIQIYFIGFLFSGINIAMISCFSAIAKPKSSFILAFLRGFALIAALIFPLSEIWGLIGVWMTVPLTELLTMLTSIFIFLYDVHSFQKK